LKGNYATFTLITRTYDDINNNLAIGLSPGRNDQIEKDITVDYSKMSYINQSFLHGTEKNSMVDDIRNLLNIVKAGGITSYIEILKFNGGII